MVSVAPVVEDVVTAVDALAGAGATADVTCPLVSVLAEEEAETFEPLESTALPFCRACVGDFAGGKSSCETAIAISERNRARKKRLSIQGTGSYPPGRKGWHRRIRVTVRCMPLKTPCRSNASIAYAEHVG